MEHSVIRIATAVGIALLALAMLGIGPLSSASAPLSPPPVAEGREGVGPVCFWSEQGPVCVERPIELGADGLDPGGLLAALLAGPTAEERTQSLWSAIPEHTTLEGWKVWPDGTVVVRLGVPLDALRTLDHGMFEAIVQQIGWTLDPLGWQDLRVQTWDPIAEEFVPLATFLPQAPAPRKDTVLSGEETPSLSATQGGQPPAPGQGQPQGALSGKTVYVSAGHGWQWNGYAWRTQRPPYPNSPYEGPIIEDHNNAEAVNQYLLEYLWNAGAQVWPVRERDMNGVTVVVDNDDPGQDAGYFETGTWTTTSGTGYAGTDYHQAATVTGTPTATSPSHCTRFSPGSSIAVPTPPEDNVPVINRRGQGNGLSTLALAASSRPPLRTTIVTHTSVEAPAVLGPWVAPLGKPTAGSGDCVRSLAERSGAAIRTSARRRPSATSARPGSHSASARRSDRICRICRRDRS